MNNYFEDVYNNLVKLVPNLKEIMEGGPQERLNSTEITQPAIFLHSYLAFVYGGRPYLS